MLPSGAASTVGRVQDPHAVDDGDEALQQMLALAAEYTTDPLKKQAIADFQLTLRLSGVVARRTRSAHSNVFLHNEFGPVRSRNRTACRPRRAPALPRPVRRRLAAPAAEKEYARIEYGDLPVNH